MTITELTEKAKLVDDEYRKQFDLPPIQADWILLKLQEELGEATRAHLAVTGRTRHKISTSDDGKRALAEEVADVFSYILLFAQEMEIDIEKTMTEKWFKYLPK